VAVGEFPDKQTLDAINGGGCYHCGRCHFASELLPGSRRKVRVTLIRMLVSLKEKDFLICSLIDFVI
jgi:hypothetical protein